MSSSRCRGSFSKLDRIDVGLRVFIMVVGVAQVDEGEVEREDGEGQDNMYCEMTRIYSLVL